MSKPEASKLAVFEGKQIRKVLHEAAWWFVITDIISAKNFKQLATRKPKQLKAVED
ncbi:MAG: hypothetical protein WCH61_01410 [bacterium]